MAEDEDNNVFKEFFSGKPERVDLAVLLDRISGAETSMRYNSEVTSKWSREKYPNGVEVEAGTVVIEGDEDGIAISYDRHWSLPAALSGTSISQIASSPDNFYAIVGNGRERDDPEYRQHRVGVKASQRYHPDSPSKVLVTNSLAEKLGIQDGETLVIENIAQDPKTLTWEDL